MGRGGVGGLEEGPRRKWEGHTPQWTHAAAEGPSAFTVEAGLLALTRPSRLLA